MQVYHLSQAVIRSFCYLMFASLLSSCQLLGGDTQVSFANSSSSTFTIASIQFGPLTVNTALNPGTQTSGYAVPPGENALTAQIQGGSQTTTVLFSIAADNSYVITFSPGTSSPVAVSIAIAN